MTKNRERLFLALILTVSFLSYTWANQFPYFYHSDEESKALQLLYGYRNFWHPMLMLNFTIIICRLLGMDQDAQSITLVGRCLAALFSSIGVTGFVYFAFRRKGLLVGILTGLLILSLPLLFEISHYCKEDSALLMGFALSLCALDGFLSAPDARRAIQLGLAVGLAISAKYLGGVLLPIALVVILYRSQRPKLAVIFLLAVTASVLVINWQWIFHLPRLFYGLEKESGMLAFGHDGVSTHLPHYEYWRMLLNQHGWLLLFFAIWGWIMSVSKGKRFSTEFLLGVVLFVGLTLMSFSSKISERYLLPFMVIIPYLAAIGLTESGRWISQRYRMTFFTVMVPLTLLHQLNRMAKNVADFRTDSRADLSTWIGRNVPKNAKIGFSLWTRLPGIYQGEYVSGVTTLDYAADYGTIQDLRNMGYEWVVVADVESARFLDPEQWGNEFRKATFLRRRSFYQDLQKEADLVWSAPAGLVYVLNPGLRLYHLRS